MNGYPPNYCEGGARLRLTLSDFTLLQRQAKDKLAYWTDKAEEAADMAQDHLRGCIECQAYTKTLRMVAA